jgi:His-Xaa-Ser system protein HxsD
MIIEYDEKIYPRVVLLKAAYRYLENAYFHLDIINGKYIVDITNKEDSDIVVSKELFDEEMLIQATRYHIAENTKEIRKMTLARAFASTLIEDDSIASTESVSCDEHISEDILRDWFENE